VLEIQCPEACDVPEAMIATAQVGEVTYMARAAAAAIDGERQRWRVNYEARFEGAKIDQQTCEYVCWVASHGEVLAEASVHGLKGREKGSLVVRTEHVPRVGVVLAAPAA